MMNLSTYEFMPPVEVKSEPYIPETGEFVPCVHVVPRGCSILKLYCSNIIWYDVNMARTSLK